MEGAWRKREGRKEEESLDFWSQEVTLLEQRLLQDNER